MSSRKPILRARTFSLLLALLLTASVGCWEQWSNTWFPQMKWQPAVQAYESVRFEGQMQGFLPPEGAIPITGLEPDHSQMTDEEAATLLNPHPKTLASLENGRKVFNTYCITCHGPQGLGDGPVSMMGDIVGPFVAVLPLAGPAGMAKIRPDGHIYNTIRYGRRRMPSYKRIPPEDRWDVVNYVKYLSQPGVELQ